VPKRSPARLLNLEDLSNDTRPSATKTFATRLNIFGVLGRNNVLACVSVLQDGLVVWEEFIEAPIEDTGSDEGVDIANGEKMLTAKRDAGLLHTRYNDAVDEARKWGNASNEEGGDGTPVGAKFG